MSNAQNKKQNKKYRLILFISMTHIYLISNVCASTKEFQEKNQGHQEETHRLDADVISTTYILKTSCL